MMRHFFKTMSACVAIISLMTSCEPLEPSTYTEKFYRLGTVVANGDKAEFSIDYTGEKLIFKNFSSTADFAAYNVKDGDRVIANMTLHAIGHTGTFYMNSMSKINMTPIDTVAPSDTLNHYFRFSKLTLDGRFVYPDIWSNGHFINVTPASNPLMSEIDKMKYHLYPIHFMSDTLVMRLSANVPGNNRQYNSEQSTLISCDMSTLRDIVPSVKEQEWRDSILNHFDNAAIDSMYVVVTTHDSVWYNFRDTITWVQGGAVATRIPFDF